MLGNADEIAKSLKCMGHPARLEILCRLGAGPLSAGEVEEALGLPQSTVSKQLACLRASNLVSTVRHGTSITYFLSREAILSLIEALNRHFSGDPADDEAFAGDIAHPNSGQSHLSH